LLSQAKRNLRQVGALQTRSRSLYRSRAGPVGQGSRIRL